MSSPVMFSRNKVYNFPFNGRSNLEVYFLPGYYRIQVWGSQGGSIGSLTGEGGFGGYAEGYLLTNSSQIAYLNIGGRDGTNGGGAGGSFGTSNPGASGGGSTDVRLSQDINSRIIIAAGGGGGSGVKYVNTVGMKYRGGHACEAAPPANTVNYGQPGQPAKGITPGVGGKGGLKVEASGANTLLIAGGAGGGGSGYAGGGGGGSGHVRGTELNFAGNDGSNGGIGFGGKGANPTISEEKYGVYLDPSGGGGGGSNYASSILTNVSCFCGSDIFLNPSGNTEKGGDGFIRVTKILGNCDLKTCYPNRFPISFIHILVFLFTHSGLG